MAVAALDAVRRDDAPREPGPPPELAGGGKGVAEDLRRLGARGELLLHDGVCSETVLSLPGLERQRTDLACAPSGARSPDGMLVARCVDDGIEVLSAADGELRRLSPGCTPAWRPDGELTASYRDEVVRFGPCPGHDPCPETLISRGELERAARLHPAVPDVLVRVRALVDGVAWVTQDRAAVSISIRLGGRFDRLGPLNAIAFFRDGRLDGTTPHFRVTGGHLAPSPRGTYVAQAPDMILRRDGSQVSLPQHLRDAQDLAWSPDERFLALATPFAITIVPTAGLERYDATGGGLRSVTIPQAAALLAWRAPNG